MFQLSSVDYIIVDFVTKDKLWPLLIVIDVEQRFICKQTSSPVLGRLTNVRLAPNFPFVPVVTLKPRLPTDIIDVHVRWGIFLY